VNPYRSNGYEEFARRFAAIRDNSTVGVGTVAEWAKSLPEGARVLDLGCGNGVPISQLLVQCGLRVHGVDASPTLVEQFRKRLPGATVDCATVEDALVPESQFDAAIAWGLIFLLSPEVQALVIDKVSRTLRPGGRFLFTAPAQQCEWPDALTGRHSVSLGAARYQELLEQQGLKLLGTTTDEGGNHYFLAARLGSDIG
jgi:2-polyprenyl-3-methyl-5-hydroxy-6-metoxy-1,4-benzoquinol methylase